MIFVIETVHPIKTYTPTSFKSPGLWHSGVCDQTPLPSVFVHHVVMTVSVLPEEKPSNFVPSVGSKPFNISSNVDGLNVVLPSVAAYTD